MIRRIFTSTAIRGLAMAALLVLVAAAPARLLRERAEGTAMPNGCLKVSQLLTAPRPEALHRPAVECHEGHQT